MDKGGFDMADLNIFEIKTDVTLGSQNRKVSIIIATTDLNIPYPLSIITIVPEFLVIEKSIGRMGDYINKGTILPTEIARAFQNSGMLSNQIDVPESEKGIVLPFPKEPK